MRYFSDINTHFLVLFYKKNISVDRKVILLYSHNEYSHIHILRRKKKIFHSTKNRIFYKSRHVVRVEPGGVRS